LKVAALSLGLPLLRRFSRDMSDDARRVIDGYLRLPCSSIATGGTGRSGIAISYRV